MSSSETKPSLPESYVVPKVWKNVEQGGKWGAMNQPTSGPRFDRALKKGSHDLQLYSLGTPNGMKVTILLEELNDAQGTEYDAWKIDISEMDQFGSEFVALNPNSKIPAMYDYSYDPPLRIFESGNILKYVGEKYNAFIPTDPRKRVEMYNWLFFQVGTAPLLGGGFGHFYNYAPIKIEYAIDRYTMETKRQLDVLDKNLEGKKYMVGDEYTIADMAIYPWILCIIKFYKAAEFVDMESYKNVNRWMKTVGDRPAVQRGMRVNGVSDDKVVERHSRADFD